MNMLLCRRCAVLVLAALLAGPVLAGAKDKDKKKKEAEPLEPPAPTMKDKTGEPVHDYIVDFERAYAEALPLFQVDEFTKHDYEACAKAAEKMHLAAQKFVQLHDDRIRQYGNDYHHSLEAVAKTLKSLKTAVKDHHRTDIFTNWAQLKQLRNTLAETGPWKE